MLADYVEVVNLGHSNKGSELARQLKDLYSSGMPILRIGLIESRDSIEFRLSGRFSVLNDQGIAILKDVTSNVKWRVKIEQRQPSKYTYSIVLGQFQERLEAQELEYNLIEKGIGTRITTRGGKLYYNDRIVNDNTQFWVVVDRLASEEEAQTFAKERLSEFSYHVIKEKINEPHALIELFDSEYEKLGEAENVIRIVPESYEVITYIYDSMLDNEIQSRVPKYRIFSGPLEFRSTNDGRVIIICEMPLEKYVESVVALEMKSEFPIEIIKAQAIAVRSKTIASLGIKHYEDPYNLCSGAHCQTFNGITQTAESVLKAVQETIGIVLRDNRQVTDANYSLICGGHTEAYHSIFDEDSKEPYPPIFDGSGKDQKETYRDLTRDDNLKKWVREEPDVYCNLSNTQSSNVINYIRGQFRWQISYDRQELEEIISTKTCSNIGIIYDIIPIRRGVSGRILELEILASNQNLTLNGEWNIRQTLTNDGLSSSCFDVDRQFDDDGFPIAFTFNGAGTGHGVGLCQAGGLVMALRGTNHVEILAHYFKGIKLKKIY